MAPRQTKTVLSSAQRAVLSRGAKIFNKGQFFKAHEEWETGWRVLPVPERFQVQGAILVCGVFVLLEKGRVNPAERLARLAVERFAEAATASQIHKIQCVLVLPEVENRLLKLIARIRLGERDPIRLGLESKGLRSKIAVKVLR